MCQYCGCREIETIELLTEDHVQIQNRCGDTARAVAAGDYAKAVRLARELAEIFRIHNAVEEQALYLSIGRNEEFADQTGRLYDEHDELDDIIAEVIALDDAGRLQDVDWQKVLDAYDVLYEHINAEENGLFPAAAINFDPEDWERCERMRAQAEATHGVLHHQSGSHDHPHSHA